MCWTLVASLQAEVLFMYTNAMLCYGFMIMRHLGFLENRFRLLATKFKYYGLFVLHFINIGPYRIDYFQNVPELWIIQNPLATTTGLLT